MPSRIDTRAIDHVGLRITDFTRSLAFYEQLGFELVAHHVEHGVAIVRNGCGAELNFVINAKPGPTPTNVLMDVEDKHPGYTHMALEVASIEETVAALGALGVPITEGPVALGDGISMFIRDPDRNVIELRCDRGAKGE